MGLDNSKNTGYGVHTIIFALKTILYNSNEKQKVITPRYFAKTVKGGNIHDYRNTVEISELKRYKHQLMNAYNYWEDDEWKCVKKEDRTFRLIFTKREKYDKEQ